MRLPTRKLAVSLLCFALGACGVYRAEVRQGNYIQTPKIEQVAPGMSRAQVRFLMGPPMVADPFHPDRWDYVFSVDDSETQPARPKRHVVVLFDGDVVRSITELKDAPAAR
jgi:outer membrane protein assembly factor BamE